MKRSVYLDYAAATPVRPEVLKAMEPFYEDEFYNPSALYLRAQAVRRAVEAARLDVAKAFGVRGSEIIFTAGGTEANNLLIHGIMQQYPEGSIIMAAIEHDSVLEPARKYANREIAVLTDGQIDKASLRESIDDNTVLVSIGLVNNEIGTVQNLSEIATELDVIRNNRSERSVATPLYLHTDACQAGNYISLQVSKLGVDAMTVNGSKLYGPKQSGALYVRAGIELSPLIIGGGQERGLRSGTENVPAIIGLAKALSLAQFDRQSASNTAKALQAYFIKQLQRRFPDVIINGSLKRRIANNVHVTFPGQDNERILMALDERGVMCATGSACSASKDEPSHVLSALGIDEALAQSSLRFTLGAPTTKIDIDFTLKQLESIL